MLLILLLALMFVGLAVSLALKAALGGSGAKTDVLSQVAAYGFASGRAPAIDQTNPLQTREIANRIGVHLVSRLQAEQARALRQLLNSAGYYRTTVTQYLGYRALAVVGLPLAVLLLGAFAGSIGIVTIVIAAIAGGIGWILPKTLVERKAAQRTTRIDYEVPELVDLLVTSIEAGVGFGSALQLSARRVRDPLGQELRLTLGEQAMGLTMNEALQNMLERTNRSASMRAFVQAIVQGETMGVSIGKTLRDLALDMRKRRRQAAEERAQKAPIKLLFPLTFLILPAMMIVILGPAVRAVAHGLGGG
jgi:tight adherence protein C